MLRTLNTRTSDTSFFTRPSGSHETRNISKYWFDLPAGVGGWVSSLYGGLNHFPLNIYWIKLSRKLIGRSFISMCIFICRLTDERKDGFFSSSQRSLISIEKLRFFSYGWPIEEEWTLGRRRAFLAGNESILVFVIDVHTHCVWQVFSLNIYFGGVKNRLEDRNVGIFLYISKMEF